jgi:hypothetical protein
VKESSAYRSLFTRTVEVVTVASCANIYIRLNVSTRRLAMADQFKMLYCRGCNTECEEHHFDGYKQCSMCREKSFTRKRRKITCECGRTLLACSLKIHLRSIYHNRLPHQQLASRNRWPRSRCPRSRCSRGLPSTQTVAWCSLPTCANGVERDLNRCIDYAQPATLRR